MDQFLKGQEEMFGMQPPKKRHCWHSMGLGTSHGSGGTLGFECCWCGTVAHVRWSTVHRQMKGHGPHAFESERVYDWPDLHCEKRK